MRKGGGLRGKDVQGVEGVEAMEEEESMIKS